MYHSFASKHDFLQGPTQHHFLQHEHHFLQTEPKKISEMKVKELQKELKSKGLSTKGKKAVLIERLSEKKSAPTISSDVCIYTPSQQYEYNIISAHPSVEHLTNKILHFVKLGDGLEDEE